MNRFRDALYDIRFAVGEFFVPRTVYGAVLESSLDAAFDEIKVLERLLKAERSVVK